MRTGGDGIRWGNLVVLAALASAGCGLGPRSLCATRLPYNEAVKVTTEEQLLLNIVRLRYSDNASSLAVTNIAAQFELVHQLQLVPFFTAAGAGDVGTYRGTVLPGAQCSTADRPTLSLTPQDEVEFTRRLFTPISLEGITYLAQTTWPIDTVFRLYLENLNWVSNAENLSGPTPERLTAPPEFEEFLRGVAALRRLQSVNQVVILQEEYDERVGSKIAGSLIQARDLVEAARANHEFKRDDEVETAEDSAAVKEKKPAPKPDDKTAPWALIKKKQTSFLFVDPGARTSPDWLEFCRVFKIRPDSKKYQLEVAKLEPFPVTFPPEGLTTIDLETRSLLQVLFFVAHGVEVPPEHVVAGRARMTIDLDGSLADYDRVLGGLFKVRSAKCKKRPPCAAVAVQYLDHWYYIEETDHTSRATFALLFYLSKLELGAKPGAAPLLTIPLGK
jgi:hypothetical protein